MFFYSILFYSIIWVFFRKFRVVSVCFGLLRNSSVCFDCFDIGSKHRNKPKFLVFGFTKQTRKRSCFGLFRFEPKTIFVCFEDTLVGGHKGGGKGFSLMHHCNTVAIWYWKFSRKCVITGCSLHLKTFIEQICSFFKCPLFNVHTISAHFHVTKDFSLGPTLWHTPHIIAAGSREGMRAGPEWEVRLTHEGTEGTPCCW